MMKGRAMPTLWPIVALVVSWSCHVCAKDAVVYVDAAARGANDGTSWVDAYVCLQDALTDAKARLKPVNIRVAQGVYRPDQGNVDTSPPGWRFRIAFELGDGVTIQGGYAGVSRRDPEERNIQLYETVLSGDLEGDDIQVPDLAVFLGDPGCKYDNSETVVRIRGNAVIEGLTIAGAAQIGYFQIVRLGEEVGGGLCIWEGEPVVRFCTFRGNLNRYDGGAICGKNTRISDCTFEGNCAGRLGGAACVAGSLDNCVFTRNKAWYSGAVAPLAPGLVAAKCLFVGNRAFGHWDAACGGAIRCGGKCDTQRLYSGNVRIANCTFHGNQAKYGADIFNGQTDLLAVNCIFRDGPQPIWDSEGKSTRVRYSNIEGGWPGVGNIDVDPLFAGPGRWDPNDTPDDPNDDFWVDGDYHLKSRAGRWNPATETWVIDDVTSPCIDAGDPNSPIGHEPFPNGGRVNMGAYSGTAEASKSYFGEPVCETIIAGDINGDCRVDFADFKIMSRHWLRDETQREPGP